MIYLSFMKCFQHHTDDQVGPVDMHNQQRDEQKIDKAPGFEWSYDLPAFKKHRPDTPVKKAHH